MLVTSPRRPAIRMPLLVDRDRTVLTCANTRLIDELLVMNAALTGIDSK